ncbi:MAG: hypothetical protein WCK84_13735 [Bacteroidota bacterium]
MTSYQKMLLQIIGENGWDIFNHKMLLDDGRLSHKELNQAMRSFLNQGEITQIEKGRYRRQHFTDENVIACFLVPDGGIAYWSALNMHGLTEQFPNFIMIQNSARKGEKNIPGMGTTCKFIKVKPEKITGYQMHGYGNHTYSVTDVEKTIIDCFDLPEYSGGYPELIKAFHKAKLNSTRMIKYSRITGNISVIKRVAYLSELLSKAGMEEYLQYAGKNINERYTPFDFSLPHQGKFLNRWRLILNVTDEEILAMAEPLKA